MRREGEIIGGGPGGGERHPLYPLPPQPAKQIIVGTFLPKNARIQLYSAKYNMHENGFNSSQFYAEIEKNPNSKIRKIDMRKSAKYLTKNCLVGEDGKPPPKVPSIYVRKPMHRMPALGNFFFGQRGKVGRGFI